MGAERLLVVADQLISSFLLTLFSFSLSHFLPTASPQFQTYLAADLITALADSFKASLPPPPSPAKASKKKHKAAPAALPLPADAAAAFAPFRAAWLALLGVDATIRARFIPLGLLTLLPQLFEAPWVEVKVRTAQTMNSTDNAGLIT